MVVVYLIPHSMYGSQLDYDKLDSGVDPAEAIGHGWTFSAARRDLPLSRSTTSLKARRDRRVGDGGER
ncbi:MAG: hypothetical protein QGH45_03325 [Myxococcota bacterium]|jgi:hypothetical protein|nr:hypothetical protein [Myxococcota bacterium]